jgi:hypothetical protein
LQKPECIGFVLAMSRNPLSFPLLIEIEKVIRTIGMLGEEHRKPRFLRQKVLK